MVSLKSFIEDVREERRTRNERVTKAFTLTLAFIFLAGLSIWSATI